MLDTPIWQLTPRQLFKLQEEWFKEMPQQPTTQQPTTEWVPVDKASELFGRSKASIYRWIQSGRIASKEIGCITLVNVKNCIKKEFKATKRTFKTA